MPSAYHNLLQFLQQRMRMSHIYQPLMIKTLLQNMQWVVRASVLEIAPESRADLQPQV